MGRKLVALVVVAVLLFGVVASGCIGGKGSEISETYSESSSSGGTESGGESTHASWETPWDAYNPVKVDGDEYYITYIRYTFTVKTPEGEKSYEVEKRRGYVRVHVYADENGEKKDLGEFNLFAYYGKIAPAEDPEAAFEYLVAVKERTEETDQYFLQPLPNFGTLGTGATVIAEAKSESGYFFWSNPAAIGQYSELPYTEGDIEEALEGLGDYITPGWMAMMGSGAWSGLEGHDLMERDEYSFSFMGMEYSYKIEPDGKVSLGGKDFSVSNVEWSYSVAGNTMQGKAKIAPALPVPVETEGTFTSMSQGVKVYSKLKIEDMKLEKEFGGMEISIEKPTSPGEETETSTQTETETPPESSENWKLAWDASEPLKIGEDSYIITGVTYDITYKTAGGEVHYTMERGYKKELNGYVAYAIVEMDDGSTYRFEVHFDDDELGEYTGWVLWMPSVFQLIESNSPEKIEITGSSCSYTYDEENGIIGGDMTCGAEIRESPFDQIWDRFNGFAGGIYGDVVDVTSLSGSGKGYTVESDGTITLAGMDFEVYKVTWSGELVGMEAHGETKVVPELPFPVEIEASIAYPGSALYLHTTVTKIELEPAG